jgi:uncharacterized membrane protein
LLDKPVKSIAKTISYIVGHYILQSIVVFVITGNFALTATIISLAVAIETVYYYTHERVWNHISAKLRKRKHKHKIIDELV